MNSCIYKYRIFKDKTENFSTRGEKHEFEEVLPKKNIYISPKNLLFTNFLR